MKIQKIEYVVSGEYDGTDVTRILFDNGKTLESYHNVDCCESVYADFRNMQVMGQRDENYIDSNDLDFFEDILSSVVPIEGLGFYLVTKQGICLLVSCYNIQNGYYGNNLTLLYDGKERDISECTSWDANDWTEESVDKRLGTPDGRRPFANGARDLNTSVDKMTEEEAARWEAKAQAEWAKLMAEQDKRSEQYALREELKQFKDMKAVFDSFMGSPGAWDRLYSGLMAAMRFQLTKEAQARAVCKGMGFGGKIPDADEFLNSSLFKPYRNLPFENEKEKKEE